MAAALMGFKPKNFLAGIDGITYVVSNQDNGSPSTALANALVKVRTKNNVPDWLLEFDADLGTPNGSGPLKDTGDTRIFYSNGAFVDVQG